MNITRYALNAEPDMIPSMVEDPIGTYVAYSDYAAQKHELSKLGAENTRLKGSLHKAREYIAELEEI